MLAVARYGWDITDVVVIFSVVTAIMQAMITVTILKCPIRSIQNFHNTVDFAIFQFAEVLRDAVQLY